MNNLPEDLFDLILTYVETKDIQSLNLVSKKYNNLINNSIKIGSFYTEKIQLCNECKKHHIHPIHIKLVDIQENNIRYTLCSDYCKNSYFCTFPRCYFCLSTIDYTGEVNRTLFCSDSCTESSERNVLRGFQLL